MLRSRVTFMKITVQTTEHILGLPVKWSVPGALKYIKLHIGLLLLYCKQ